MSKTLVGTLAGVLLLVLLSAGNATAGREEEKAREKAWEDARAAFLKDYASPDPAVRRAAVMKLRAFVDDGGAELVADRVLGSERSYAVLEAAISVVGASRNPKVIGWLVKKATGHDDWPVRARVVEALASVDTGDSRDAIRKLLGREKDPRVLSMAIFSAEALKMKDAVDLIIPFLEYEDWQVRVAAIEALAEFKEERAIVPLIDALMNERGRLRQDLADALKRITGQHFGRDANRWRKWFYERDKAGEAEKEPEKPKARPDPGTSMAEPDGPTYFGMKVISDRVLFIIDVSLSMKTPIDIDKMKLAREAVVTGKPDDPDHKDKDKERFEDTVQWWKIKDRLDLAKAQLEFVIKNLQKTQQFEICSFSDSVKSWNGGHPVKATPLAKAKALQFVETLEVEGATSAGAVLDWAFEMAGPGASDKNYKTGVDTIYFLSDGAPSDRPVDQILDEVRARNVLRKIRINVVAILNVGTPFLRLLAEQNGGEYRFFKVEDKK